MHRVAGEILLDRHHPFGLIAGQIGLGHAAAMVARMACQLLRQFAAVVSFTLGGGDFFQTLGRFGENKFFTHVRRAAMRHEGLRVTGLVLQQRHGIGPLALHDGRNQMAARSQVDGRFEQVGKGQLAQLIRQRDPAGHGARHGHAIPASHGKCVAVFFREVVARPGRRCSARRIQAVQLAAIPHDGEGIAAQATGNGFDYGKRSSRRDRRIDGIAALLQHAQAGLRRQRLRGGDDVTGEDGRACRRIGVGPVEGCHGAIGMRKTPIVAARRPVR